VNGVHLARSGTLHPPWPCRVCFAFLTCIEGQWYRKERSVVEVLRKREARKGEQQKVASPLWDEIGKHRKAQEEKEQEEAIQRELCKEKP
jgi:hypothetical protein